MSNHHAVTAKYARHPGCRDSATARKRAERMAKALAAEQDAKAGGDHGQVTTDRGGAEATKLEGAASESRGDSHE